MTPKYKPSTNLPWYKLSLLVCLFPLGLFLYLFFHPKFFLKFLFIVVISCAIGFITEIKSFQTLLILQTSIYSIIVLFFTFFGIYMTLKDHMSKSKELYAQIDLPLPETISPKILHITILEFCSVMGFVNCHNMNKSKFSKLSEEFTPELLYKTHSLQSLSALSDQLFTILREAYKNKTLLPEQAKALFLLSTIYKYHKNLELPKEASTIIPYLSDLLPSTKEEQQEEYKDLDIASLLFKKETLNKLTPNNIQLNSWKSIKEESDKLISNGITFPKESIIDWFKKQCSE